MTPERLAALADVSERLLLRDLAILRDLRAEQERAAAEITQLRNRAAREIAMLQTGAGPVEHQAAAKWQAEADRRLRVLAERRAEIVQEEERARAAALEAFGRGRAVELLTTRAKAALRERQRRRAERDGLPV
ncbi:MAG: hypothetical protein AAFR17_15570 [Pseudomonadota bacterium]